MAILLATTAIGWGAISAFGYSMRIQLSTAWAILIVGALIAASLLGSEWRFGARYQIAPAMGADGNPFVWRVDTVTGEVESCTFEKVTNPFTRIGEHGETLSPVQIECLAKAAQGK